MFKFIKNFVGYDENIEDEKEIQQLLLDDKIKTYIYCRVSTPTQAKSDKHSMDVQRNMCLDFIQTHNLEIDTIVHEVGSAYNQSKVRIKLQSLINKKKCNIIVMNVDRFCRNIEKGIEMLEKVIKNKSRLIFVEENIIFDEVSYDITFPKLKKLLKSAQAESEKISKRISATFLYKKKHGIFTGRSPKFGCQVIDKKLAPNPHEQKIIEFIGLMRTRGESISKINNALKSLYKGKFVRLELSNDSECLSEPLTYHNIADVLNDYDILKRNIKWNSRSVSSVDPIPKIKRNLKIKDTNEMDTKDDEKDVETTSTRSGRANNRRDKFDIIMKEKKENKIIKSLCEKTKKIKVSKKNKKMDEDEDEE